MALTQLKINNLTSNQLSLDIPLDDRRQIRELVPRGGYVDVAGRATLDELNRNPIVQRLRGVSPVGTPKISITVVEGDDDLVGETTQVVNRLVADTDVHMQLEAPGAGKTIRLNSITKTGTANSNIGFQAKPGQGASMANNVIGAEISPRLNDAVALTGSGSIIGLHADVYLKGTSGNIAGDVRGAQIELVDDGSAGRTISGDAIGLRFRSNLSCTAITGKHAPLSVENGEGSQKWDALAKIEAETGVFDKTTAVNATQNGYLLVHVDGADRYIPLYTGHA
jgi:hypothetical protein